MNNVIDQKSKKRKWKNWAIGFAIWTIVGLSFASRSLFHAYRENITVDWREIVSGFLIDFYIWGAVSPLIFRVAERFPIERGRIAGRIFFRFAVSIFLFLPLILFRFPLTNFVCEIKFARNFWFFADDGTKNHSLNLDSKYAIVKGEFRSGCL